MEYKKGDTVEHKVFGSGVVLLAATARNIRRDFLGLRVWPRG